MATNHYFNFYPQVGTPDQMLIQELVTQAIQIFGADCYYLPRESWSDTDTIFGEDVSSKFESAYRIEMYIETGNEIDGRFGGMNDYFSKFGLEIRDDCNFAMSRQAFDRYVPGNIRLHPQEGDLIYVPTFDKIFEVKFVEQDVNFFSLGKKNPYLYQLQCESFRYSGESIDTGVDEIDAIELENSYTIKLTLTSGNDTDYWIGETVYVGNSLASANQTANVVNWILSNTTIHLTDIKGEFNTGTLIGASSNAQYTISAVDNRDDHSIYDFFDNQTFENEANTIIDKITEVNPLGIS